MPAHQRRLRALAGQLAPPSPSTHPSAAPPDGGELVPIEGWPEYLPMYDFVEVERFQPGDPRALEHVDE